MIRFGPRSSGAARSSFKNLVAMTISSRTRTELLQRLADELFRLSGPVPGADAVLFRRIEEVDADVERRRNDPGCLSEVAALAEKIRAEVVGAQAHHGHFERSERTSLQ